MFHSDREHKGVELIFIGLVVHCKESSIYMQADILTFMKSIEVDLKKVRDMCEEGLDPGRRHSYCLLLTNYGSIMAILKDPPYCLVYPIVYHKNVEDPSHFNTSASSSGMQTHACMYCTLLKHVDMEPLHQRTFKGSHLIIPHGMQYRTLFPEIVALCNHQGPLIDPDMNEPSPCLLWEISSLRIRSSLAPMGIAFSSWRATSPSSRKRTSTSLLTRRRRLNPPPSRKADMGLMVPRRASPCPSTRQRSPAKQKKLARQKCLARPVAKLPWPPHHSFQTPPEAKSHPGRGKPLQPRRDQITVSPRMAILPDTRKGPIMKRVGNLSLTRKMAVPSANMGDHHLQVLTPWGVSPRNPALKCLPMLPARAHQQEPQEPLYLFEQVRGLHILLCSCQHLYSY